MRILMFVLMGLSIPACDKGEVDDTDSPPEESDTDVDTDTDTDTDIDCDDSDGDGVCDEDDICQGDDVTGDTDGDGTCNDTDTDDDSDGVEDGVDTAPTDPFACGDSDADTCEDCITGGFDPAADGDDWDADGLCDIGDSDDDNDGIGDGVDTAPTDPFVCGDSDADTCEDCITGGFDPAADGDDWDADGLCDAVDPEQFVFASSQVVDGKTITCGSTAATSTYTECAELKVDGLYFPNGITCGPLWSTTESSYTRHADFCALLTGSSRFEVYYTCDSTTTRVTYFASSGWGTFNDNGYTRDIRCYY